MTPPATSYPYDVFLSYRHGEPDEDFTRNLLRDLGAAGFKVVIDQRDFHPPATFRWSTASDPIFAATSWITSPASRPRPSSIRAIAWSQRGPRSISILMAS